MDPWYFEETALVTVMPNFKSYLRNRLISRKAKHSVRGVKSSTKDKQVGIDTHLTEVLFETFSVGNSVKVSAIDPSTNTEVCVIGSIHMTPYSLKVNALRKLEAAVRKQRKR